MLFAIVSVKRNDSWNTSADAAAHVSALALGQKSTSPTRTTPPRGPFETREQFAKVVLPQPGGRQLNDLTRGVIRDRIPPPPHPRRPTLLETPSPSTSSPWLGSCRGIGGGRPSGSSSEHTVYAVEASTDRGRLEQEADDAHRERGAG